MLKRNLIAIAIITLGLGITSAFGQAADWEIKPAVKNPKTSVKKPDGQSIFTNDTIDKLEVKSKRSITSNSSTKTRRPAVSKSFYAMINGQSAGKGKQPQKRSKSKNPGDTGTHEVGHKQGKRCN